MNIKNLIVLVLLAGHVFFAGLFARTVTIASCDRETGAVALAFSEAEAEDGVKTLFAGWAPGAMGKLPSGARLVARIGEIAPETTEAAFTVPAAWRVKSGTVQFFLMGGTAPYARRFAFLRTPSAGPWIDTGVVPNADTDLSITTLCRGDCAAFGVSQKFYFFAAKDNDDQGDYFGGFFGAFAGGGPTVFVTAPRGSVPRTLRLNATGAMVDGVRYYAFFDPVAITETTTSSMTLFARRNDGLETVAKQGDITIYSAQIREAGTLTRDYVPCETKEGLRTLYNRVDGTFAAVSGTGTFEVGEVLDPAPQDCGALESASAALRFAPDMAVSSHSVVTGELTVTLAGEHDGGLLLAVGGAEDAGTEVAAWETCAFLAKVPANATTVTATLPTSVRTDNAVVRLLWCSAEDFPYDHEIDSVQSSGSDAYLLTDWIPTRATEFSVTGRSNPDVCLTGLTIDDYFFTTGSATFWGFFGLSGSFDAVDATVWHTWRLGPAGAFLDDALKAGPFVGASFVEQRLSLPLPFRRDRATGGLTKTGKAWIKAAQIREGEDLVRDYVPCVSNGVVGLYDRVQGVFSASMGGTAFVAGDTVAPTVTDGDVLAWSDSFSITAEQRSAAWDAGGGTDVAVTTAANWVGDTVPDLTSGLTTVTFAEAGLSARIVEPVTMYGLVFDITNDFAVTAGGAAASLALGVGGVTLQDNAADPLAGDWRYARIGVPVELVSDQTWNLSSTAKRRLQLEAGLRGTAKRTLTVTGDGALGITAPSTFAGDVVLEGGVTKIVSTAHPFGLADAGGMVTLDQEKGAKWQQFDSTMDKPLLVRGKSTMSDGFLLNTLDGTSTNAFTASVTVEIGSLYVEAESATAFTGGGRAENALFFTGNGPLVFGEKPFTNGRLVFATSRDVTFSSTGNNVVLEFRAAGRLNFARDNVLSYWSDISLDKGTTMDLQGTYQDMGDLSMANADDRVTSASPATLFSFYEGDAVLKGRFTGQVAFLKSGAGTATLQGANDTTGALVVRAGKLVLGEGGSWAATDIQVGLPASNRKPTLRVTHKDAFASPRETTLTLTTATADEFYMDLGNRNPVLELDADVALHVKAIVLDGKRLASGWWGGEDSNAANKDALHFTGQGMVYVAGEGSVLIIR